MKCLIENCSYEHENLVSFARHLQFGHEVTSEEYSIRYLHNNLRPVCQECGSKVRYVRFTFKKYCAAHAFIAEKEAGSIGGKKKKTWNKGTGRSKATFEEIKSYVQSLGVVYKKRSSELWFPELNYGIRLNHFSETTWLRPVRLDSSGYFNIFVDEWREKQEIVKSMIRYRLKLVKSSISASKCQCQQLEQTREFFDSAHVSGNTRAKTSFALVYEGEIVAALSLRKPFSRAPKYKRCVEIARFAVKKNTKVPGAFSRLLARSKEWAIEQGYLKLISYADLRFGNGDVYLKSNFALVGQTPINYWYSDGIRKYHRLKFRAANGKSEHQIAEENGVWRVFGCGSNIYELDLSLIS